jgi:tetratricopeptide (TPR) repeat protein
LAQIPETPVHRLAWHQLNAGQWHLAAASWEEAGDQARRIYAYEEALRAYRFAATCIRRDTTRTEDSRDLSEFELLVKADEVLSVLGRPAERREIVEKLGTLCKANGRESQRSVWLKRRALLEEHVGNFGAAVDLAREAWVLSRSGNDPQGEVEALRVLAWALHRSGSHRRSLSVLEVALRKAGDSQPKAIATLLWQAAALHIALGNQEEALACTRRARAVLNGIGWRGDHPLLLIAEGAAYKWTGRLRCSRTAFLKALQSASETSESVLTARAVFQLAMLDAIEGDLGGSLRKLRRALVESRKARYTRTHASCLNEIANGIGRLIGRYDWAWNASTAAIRLLMQSDNRGLLAMCRDSQAQLLLEENRLDEAAAAVDEVLRLSGGGDSGGEHHGPYLDSLTKRGMISLNRDDLAGAVADLETVRNVLRQTGERLQLPDVLSHLALAYAGCGDLERALSTSKEAVRTLTEMGNANYQPQRIFWHHYQILAMAGREPRAVYLEKAVECIETQAASLSPAQGRRLRGRVALNREILAAWDRQRPALNAQAAP